MDLTFLIFLLVYVAMAFGTLPGFKVDRTGAAVAGAMTMIAVGSIGPQQSWNAIDYKSVGMLFGLMVVSAAFIVSGFYAHVAKWVVTLKVSPPMLLAILIAVSGTLSAVLTNDVVVVAMTPLLVSITLARGLNPVPFLLAFCFAANTGASGTLMGSPQNMIAAQGLQMSFAGFLKAALLPAIISLPIVWLVVAAFYRGHWQLVTQPDGNASVSSAPVPLNRLETAKAIAVATVVILAFAFTDWPRELVALGAAAVLLVNRTVSSTDMMKHVDGSLLLLFMGLFVVNAAMASTGLPQHLLAYLRGEGVNLNEPITLFFVSGVLSNIVGNNAAVMLLVPFLEPGVYRDALGAALALGTGFSSSLVIFGSLAGIIVVEQAAAHGVKISFKEFSRAGLPVAIACMMMAAVWIFYLET
ncbi:MAG: transporter [Cereibacter sphaeroides]|uniref:Transporter n=1 Tax=Cereibacter sphaeroides TaxID=1063 RepID=A0A2W5S1U8_CERSP|nr:MAG: transporter [Cereibacter sphaeroides]